MLGWRRLDPLDALDQMQVAHLVVVEEPAADLAILIDRHVARFEDFESSLLARVEIYSVDHIPAELLIRRKRNEAVEVS